MELNLEWRRHTSALWPEVSYALRPLRVWAYHELLTFWQSQEHEGKATEPAGRISARGLELAEVAKRILPEHARELQGVVLVREGARQPATLEALCEEAGLMPLAGEMIARLVDISIVSPSAEKN